MHRFLVSRYNLRLTVITLVAYAVAMRKLLASLLGGWLMIGFMTWGLFSLGCGQPVNIFLFAWYYINATLLSFSLAWKFVRNMRKRLVRTLQPAN